MDNITNKKYTVFDDNNDDGSLADEKTDATPENMKKIDDVISSSTTDNKTSFNYGNEPKKNTTQKLITENLITAGVNNDELKIIEDESSPNSTLSNNNDNNISSSSSCAQQSLSFTIDFGNTNNTKYKTMLERFQSRHKRGASMSKLDNNNFNNINNIDDNNISNNIKNNSSPIVTKTTRILSSAQNYNNNNSRDSRKNYNDTEAGKVKLRIRERSTSGVRDPSKRHSWSPRSSTVEPQNFPITENLQLKQKLQNTQNKLKSITILNKEDKQQQQQQSQERPKPIKSQTSIEKRKTNNSTADGGGGIYKQSGRNDFAPRSTAMQMALDKIDFLGLQPPLDNFIEQKQQLNLDGDDDVSETGTYTLDGDNYTEEQKDLMNIDKTISELKKIDDYNNSQQKAIDHNSSVELPSDLSIYSFNSVRSQGKQSSLEKNSGNKNILEVNYYHESTICSKPKVSYLEKIKSRVKNFTKSPDKIIDKQQQSSNDKGTFTSITTSGILAKKLTLDPNPKLNYRKNSLTTSQIDSTEYIGNDYILKSSNLHNSPYSSGLFTDHEKAEYRLLTNQNSSSNNDIDNETPPLTPDSPPPLSTNKKYSDTAGLKTAQTKSDWIQEWARNARARSVSTATTTSSSTKNNNNNVNKISNNLMSRSYNCEAGGNSENDYELIDNNNFSPGNSDYLYRNNNNNKGLLYKTNDSTKDRKKSLSELILNGRPPVSPSKIPSPMHSIGRARSISKNRGSLQDLSPASQYNDNTDIYLQKTAAAISNLSQNLSRKNSLRSLNSMNSPRKGFQYQQQEQQYTNELFKIPDNNIIDKNVIQHKRNLSLDYHRLQNNNNKSSISNNLNDINNDYRLPRPRINSFDSNNLQQYNNNQYGSPGQQKAANYIDQTLQSIKQNHQQQHQSSLSPLRRSSSFSTNKIQTGGSNRMMTPPTTIKSNVQSQQLRYNTNTNTNNNHNSQSTTTPKNSLQKSASSNNFRKMYSNDYDDSIQYYINDEDDLDYCSSEEFDDTIQQQQQYINNNQNEQFQNQQQQQSDIPLTNTRYNKALLMRIENSKQKVAGNNSITTKPAPGGVMACPNTPEMPRRQNIQQQQQRSSMRQSVPRDSSLNRLKGDVPNSLASAKKQLLQTANTTTTTGNTKPQPRYLDISKYKPQQGGNTFLKKNESKITLKNDIRRSPSASVSLNRCDPIRNSSRSIKSTIGNRPTSAVGKRDQSISKQKENELAMWKRRATYDPMKAAAEDKRKKDEAKKFVKTTESSSVLRSQSFHCGVGGFTNMDNTKINLTRRNSQQNSNIDDINNCWTLISSDDDDDDDDDEEEDGTFISSSTNTN